MFLQKFCPRLIVIQIKELKNQLRRIPMAQLFQAVFVCLIPAEFKTVFLIRMGILSGIQRAQERFQKTYIYLMFPLRRLKNNNILSCLCADSNMQNLILFSFKMFVNIAWFRYSPGHMRLLSDNSFQRGLTPLEKAPSPFNKVLR